MASAAWDDLSATEDGQAIQGVWRQIAGGNSGEVGATWEFAGSDIEFRSTSLAHNQAGWKGTFRLLSSVTPKHMNWKYPGLRETLAIYSIEGDTLKICVDTDPLSFDRPTDFSATGKKDLLVLVRQHDRQAPAAE